MVRRTWKVWMVFLGEGVDRFASLISQLYIYRRAFGFGDLFKKDVIRDTTRTRGRLKALISF
jgi:hypothetical protein